LTSFDPPLPFGGSFSVDAGDPLLFADGDRLDFAVFDQALGWEVWQSDGTPGGVRPITDFASWFPFLSNLPLPLAKAGGRLLVPVRSDRWSLWATDGRSMIRLHNCLGGCGFNYTEFPHLVTLGEEVLFTSGAGAGRELWITDGSKAGTRKLLKACTGDCRSVIELTSAKLDGRAVFRIMERGRIDLWATDGTAAGTRPLFHLPPGTMAGALPVAAGSKVFFGAANEDGMELWMSQGGEERQAANIAQETSGSDPSALVALGSRLIFQAGPVDREVIVNSKRALWSSEGTKESTARLMNPFRQAVDCTFSDCPPPMAAAGDWLALVQRPSDDVSELWRTDGTPEGTRPLLSVAAPGRIEHLGAFQNTVVFFIESPHHLETWRSDGTPAGTFQIARRAGRLQVAGVGGTGTEIYFEVWAPGAQDLWRSDGTAEGTRRVAGLTVGPGPGSNLGERPPVRLGDRVYFTIYGPNVDSEELWSTDGTEAGTFRVMEAEWFGSELRELDGKLYFVALKGLWGVWSLDVTSGVLARLHAWGSMPTSLTVFDGKLFFAAGVDFARELWSSDGTRAGTRRLLDIDPDGSSDPANFMVFGDHLYFSAFDPAHGYELWQSDGTAAGTHLFQDLAPGVLSSAPERLTVVGDRLYFTADDHAVGRELWVLH
jgi:ELWxxDGT repeat protein